MYKENRREGPYPVVGDEKQAISIHSEKARPLKVYVCGGGGGAGKSCLVYRLMHDDFKVHDLTIGIVPNTTSLRHIDPDSEGDAMLPIHLYDTPAYNGFKFEHEQTFLVQADFLLFCVDLTRVPEFPCQMLQEVLAVMNHHRVIVVYTKSDEYVPGKYQHELEQLRLQNPRSSWCAQCESQRKNWT